MLSGCAMDHSLSKREARAKEETSQTEAPVSFCVGWEAQISQVKQLCGFPGIE
jgi:hypothetical protein